MDYIDDKVLAMFYEIITPNKVELFDRIAAQRTKYISIALENIYQEHNASAVLRTCDCFGIQELNVIEKNNQYEVKRDIALGAGRWVNMYNFNKGESPTGDCIAKLKAKGTKIVATSPHDSSYSLATLPLDAPCAFFFGTERQGLSEEVMEAADCTVTIPMYGFTESFNISVSVALLLQGIRNRLMQSEFDWKLSEVEQIELKISWCRKILNGGDALENEFRRRIIKKEF